MPASNGHGGFGHVVLCKNKLDGRHYAVKKIRLKDKILPVNDRILREVATLSRLQHQHVVRYYQVDSILSACGDAFEHEVTRRMRNEFMVAWDGLRSKDNQRIIAG
ncbi:eIF-2-alpha kinase GCN2-like [Salvia miltiorrhiza]|uniref:eIF-2-alpha kinase GCN2-like n=1 Tax=Salvia miltiorrhiza TaxID=226208 RepID=UPI0025AC2298|nr:eIF-2-alpha kinase GCN2-like [Salvia miltiorrhiza]